MKTYNLTLTEQELALVEAALSMNESAFTLPSNQAIQSKIYDLRHQPETQKVLAQRPAPLPNSTEGIPVIHWFLKS